MHEDLVHRIDHVYDEVHETRADVQRLQRQMEALRRFLDPSALINAEGPPREAETETVQVPGHLQEQLEDLFMMYPGRDLYAVNSPPLSDMADAFVRSLMTASQQLEHRDELGEEKNSPEEQYLALVTCHYLMAKMEASEELSSASRTSHWPRFLKGLQNVSARCRT